MSAPMPAWLDHDWTIAVEAPLRSAPSTRSRELLEQVVAQFAVEACPRYQRRDITGDGKAETFCNAYVRDVLQALTAPVPWGLLANQLVTWLESPEGRGRGWATVSAHAAHGLANEGFPVVAGWRNEGGTGHVAVVMPSHDQAGLFIAQAGRVNFSLGPLARGFGSAVPLFFAHP